MTASGPRRTVVTLAALSILAFGAGGSIASSAPAKRSDTGAPRARPATRATERPVFTGTWTLNIEKSTFGNIPGGKPNARTDVIEHVGSRIRQAIYMLNGSRRDTATYVYALDGTPKVNVVDGRDITSVVTWEGRGLHLFATTKLLVFDMSLDERWSLAAGGRTLVLTRHVKFPLGEGDQRLVFDKQ